MRLFLLNFYLRNLNQFNYKSSYKTDDGTLYFGSIDGFVRFNPTTFRERDLTIPVVFTELFINNAAVSPKDEKPVLEQSILFTDKLTLPYHKNSFRLSSAVLNYSNIGSYQLLYKLDGFDKEWSQSESNNDIIYSNLKPGKYTLALKLHNGTTDNNEATIKTLDIHIRPPFWLSGWAYAVYVVLLILGLFGLFRFLNFRNQREQKEKMLVFEQQKERELYRSKIDFFTNVAHEIRTPLSLIKAPLEHVLMTEKVSDEVKDNLQIMSKNTDRLLSLTNQLLDFQKTESEAYLLDTKQRNVSELIRETFLRFTPLAKQKGILFELDLPESDMYIQVDKEAFLKMSSNLMSNAIKFCNSHVRLNAYIVSSEEGDFFHLFTDNDGENIPDKYREEIFKPFVHFDKEQDQTVNGTGIGLALTHSLAELHRGTLELEETSNPIRFHLTLPVGKTSDAVQELARDPENRINEEIVDNSNRATVLLVDDDMELLHFEEKILSPHYHVLTAKNGEEALVVLRETNVNLIVCDIMMPKMDGFEFTKRVKSDIEFSHIPVILLTAKVNVEAKVEGFEIGADAYIDKPFSLEVLMAQIANLLQNREKLRETFLKHPYIGANSMALTKSDEEFIGKLHTVVHDNLDNSEFVVEDIAEEFNMSRASFYRKIKGVLNLTPNEYIRVERLKKAAQLLKEKTYKVNEVCYMVGFNSPSYFSKCFQQQFGVLPKDFE
jgi:signal transduction histidine kinase/DNA-binding response OmpR family regulator